MRSEEEIRAIMKYRWACVRQASDELLKAIKKENIISLKIANDRIERHISEMHGLDTLLNPRHHPDYSEEFIKELLEEYTG